MVIAVVSAGAMKMTVDQVVEMVAMGDGLVAAFRSMLMVFIMPCAFVIRRAL